MQLKYFFHAGAMALAIVIAGCGGGSSLSAGGTNAGELHPQTNGQIRPRAAARALVMPIENDNNTCPDGNTLYTSFDTGESVFAPILFGYDLSSSGPATPCMMVSTIEETVIQGYAYETHGLAVSIHGSVHAANFIPTVGVQIFNETANGTNNPFRVIATPGINYIFNLAVDNATNDYLSSQYGLYSTSDSSCYVWANNSTTTFGTPSNEVCNDGFTAAQPVYAMAAQGANLVLVTNGQVNVLSNPATSTPTVSQVITGASTMLAENNPGQYPTWYAAAVDPIDGTIYIATTNLTTSQILSFSATANGDVAPLNVLNIPYFVSGSSLAVDTSHNLYVSLGPLVGYTDIEVFPAGASGNAVPTRTITDTNGDGWAIAVDGLQPPAVTGPTSGLRSPQPVAKYRRITH